MNVSSLKVVELKAELEKRGLSTSGLKKDLAERLTNALKDEEPPVTASPPRRSRSSSPRKRTSSPEKNAEESPESILQDPVLSDELKSETIVSVSETVLMDSSEVVEAAAAEKRKAHEEESDKRHSPETKRLKVDTDSVEEANLDSAEDGCTLHLQNLVRPYTMNALKELLQTHGPIHDFWIDARKSHCFATYDSSDVARQTLQQLNGIRWPAPNCKPLLCECVTSEESKRIIEGTSPGSKRSSMSTSRPGSAKPGLKNLFARATQDAVASTAHVEIRPVPQDKAAVVEEKKSSSDELQQQEALKEEDFEKEETVQVVDIDSLFKKTETKPVIYYQPLSVHEVEAKRRLRLEQQQQQPSSSHEQQHGLAAEMVQ